jgi:hypothetical protein
MSGTPCSSDTNYPTQNTHFLVWKKYNKTWVLHKTHTSWFGKSTTKLESSPLGWWLLMGSCWQQGITNMLALPIDKMLYTYLLCPHSEHPKKNLFQSKQPKYFHQRNWVHLMWKPVLTSKTSKSWIQCDSLCQTFCVTTC